MAIRVGSFHVPRLAAIVLLSALLAAGTTLPVLARQEATPAATAAATATTEAMPATPAPNTAGLSIVASSLANPRGMDWDGAGALYVALAGIGGDTPGTGEEMGMSASGNRGGPSASVVKVVAGCGVPVAQGLPSVFDGKAYRGVADVAFLGDDLYALIQSGGPTAGNPGWFPGIARIGADGSTTMIFNFTEWLAKNPPAEKSTDFDPNGDPFALTVDGRQLIFGDARTGLIVGVSPDGTTEKIADLSKDHPVMTGITSDRAGNLYATFLTEAPYIPGTSRVDRIAPDGTVTTVWTGLTNVTGVAIGPDNTLYALEMSAGNGIPNDTGRLVRQTGPASSADVVTGLDLPVGLAFGPDGAFYISLPAIPNQPVEGAVLRVDPAAAQPMQYAAGALTARPCSGAAAPGPGMHSAMTGGDEMAEAPVTRVASGLANPRAMAWGEDGTFYVAQSGTGDTATSTGPAAGVVRIVDRCPVAAGEGLPSSFDPYRDVLGTQDVMVMDGTVYALVATTGALDQMDPARPNGIYTVKPDGSTALYADLTKWLNANPVKDPPGDRNPRGEPFRMVPNNGAIWFVDSNSGEVDQVNPDGSIVRVADTSEQHMVITAMVNAPNGGVYLGSLTPSPHTDGTAKAMAVTADGAVTDAWTGLTTVTGLAVAPDGSLWALEMATGNDTPDGMRPNTGRLVRQTGPDSLEVVLTGLNFPIGLATGPDGALYIAGPAYGGDDRGGWILRVDPAVASGTTVSPDLMTGSDCPGAPAAAATPAAPAAAGAGDPSSAPAATATAAVAPAATAAPTAAAAPAATAATAAGTTPAAAPAAAGGTAVSIKNYAFDPVTLEVAAGTTVTWTNDDTVPHTVTANDKSFDSGNMPPGATFSHTFTTAGTVSYYCQYHAGMKATVDVK